jgi:hypothetical protein
MSVIEMPNIVAIRWTEKGADGLKQVVTSVLQQEQRAMERRRREGAATWLDPLREASLTDAPGFEVLSPEAGDKLVDIVEAVLGTPDGERWMTFRPIRDLAVRLILTEPDEQLAELSRAVGQKLIHLARSKSTLDAIRAACEGLPHVADIQKAMDAMVMEDGDVFPIL